MVPGFKEYRRGKDIVCDGLPGDVVWLGRRGLLRIWWCLSIREFGTRVWCRCLVMLELCKWVVVKELMEGLVKSY